MSRPPITTWRGRPPGQPMRVLVVDDSPTARAVLVALCDADPALVVVDAVADGATGAARTAELRPDVVIMDVFMPDPDGFTSTRRIMVDTPTPVILVTAGADPRSREIGLRALEAGALAVLRKPLGGGAEAVAFVAKVRALAEVKVIRRYERRSPAAAAVPSPPSPRARRRPEVVAVAASTGGPAALQRMLAALPADLGLPVVVVQHIVEGFTSGLAAWLDRAGPLPVVLAEDGAQLRPGVVQIGPDAAHVEVTRTGRIRLDDGPAVGGFRPSATRLFASVAAAFGPRGIAVVLTGMGIDGLDGIRAMRAAGGLVLAQDEATSVVFGMPGAVVREELAHQVAPVEELAATLSASRREDDR